MSKCGGFGRYREWHKNNKRAPESDWINMDYGNKSTMKKKTSQHPILTPCHVQ
jgi:hypothetical protein